ncbi:MAG: hypothetical protein CMN29_17485 [Sandaracinus sp.]|nr:hypothetical protein [Sandaracinus sp.]
MGGGPTRGGGRARPPAVAFEARGPPEPGLPPWRSRRGVRPSARSVSGRRPFRDRAGERRGDRRGKRIPARSWGPAPPNLYFPAMTDGAPGSEPPPADAGGDDARDAIRRGAAPPAPRVPSEARGAAYAPPPPAAAALARAPAEPESEAPESEAPESSAVVERVQASGEAPVADGAADEEPAAGPPASGTAEPSRAAGDGPADADPSRGEDDAAGGAEPEGEVLLDSMEIALPSTPPIGRVSFPSMPSLPAPIFTFGRYEVLGRLATGGMAEIYLAQEKSTGGVVRPTVVKVLRQAFVDDDEFETMFLREGRVAMQLNHPNICTVYEFGKWGGHYFIAMEYVEGATLKEIVARLGLKGRPLEPVLAAAICARVAAGLDYAHHARDSRRQKLRVVHRDVSPHNVMVRFDGHVKLLDFGVAKVAQGEDATHSEALKGKFGYLAPEQCTAGRVDGRTDVFALGICLYEALTGKRLYKRDSQYHTFQAILDEPVPSARDVDPEIPEELDRIVQKALQKEMDDRYASAGEMQEALESWIAARGEAVGASRLRRLMEALFVDDLRAGPELVSDETVIRRLEPTSIHPPVSASDPPPGLSTAEAEMPATLPPPAASRRWLIVAAALVLLLGAGLIGFTLNRPEPETSAPRATPGPSPELSPAAERSAAAEPSPAVEPPAPPAPEEGGEEPRTGPVVAEDESPPDAPAQPEGPGEGAEAVEEAAPPPDTERRRRRRRRRPGFVADPGF